MKFYWKDLVPQSYLSLKEGYCKKNFIQDFFSGISVGVIAFPLSLAFAIAAGVSPVKGLITAIVAGIIIALLGGSRYQITGPTGAYVVILFDIVQRTGVEGLAIASLIASLIMLLMGFARIGSYLKFIPQPVIIGFTSALALIIFATQIKDALGLQFQESPSHLIPKLQVIGSYLQTFNIKAFFIALSTLLMMFGFKKIAPKAPGVILALIIVTFMTQTFDMHLTTIEDKFGIISHEFSTVNFSKISWEVVRASMPDAIAIAFLGVIESLLSAIIADGISGKKHNSNMEVVAQGFANLGAILCGGIPSCGAICRTTANVKMGATSPFSGMIQAVTVLFLLLFFSGLAGKISLAALSGVIIYIAWNMGDFFNFYQILKGQKGDAFILLSTFVLTILTDLTISIPVGVMLSSFIFLSRMTKKTKILISYLDEEKDSKKGDVVVFEVVGPFFYTISNLLDEKMSELQEKPETLILRLKNIPFIDQSGIAAIQKFKNSCHEKNIKFLIADVTPTKTEWFNSFFKEGFEKKHLFVDFQLL